ncbi:MAG: hypothetical protein ACE1Y4_06725 [Lysobacterales bacterium]
MQSSGNGAVFHTDYADIATNVTLIGEDFSFERVPQWSYSVGVPKRSPRMDTGCSFPQLFY